jgi:hypothetical protein
VRVLDLLQLYEGPPAHTVCWGYYILVLYGSAAHC